MPRTRQQRILIAAALLGSMLATPTRAAVPAMTCTGESPDWTLIYSEDMATFTYEFRDSALEAIQSSTAEGRDWPVAMTLIGPEDSGVLIVEPLPEEDGFSALILTQRDEAPLLLSGTCTTD